MQLAFLVLAHKNPRQLDGLVNYLSKDSFVLVHIDKKSEADFFEFTAKYKTNPNVRIYFKYKVYWGSFNQILATFFLLNKAIEHFKFDYVHLISGQDVPTKPVSELKKFLDKSDKKDFLVIKELNGNNGWVEAGGLDRMRLYWITDFNPKFKFLFSKWNVLIHSFQHLLKLYRKYDRELYGSDNWFSLSYSTACFVNEYLTANRDFLNKFKNTRCADEIILATILMNSHLKSNIENNSLRFIDWHNGPEYPRTLREPDFERLKNAENIFIARKFDVSVDDKIIDLVYSKLLNE